MTSPPITPADLDEIRKRHEAAENDKRPTITHHGDSWDGCGAYTEDFSHRHGTQAHKDRAALLSLLSTRGDGIGSGGAETEAMTLARDQLGATLDGDSAFWSTLMNRERFGYVYSAWRILDNAIRRADTPPVPSPEGMGSSAPDGARKEEVGNG